MKSIEEQIEALTQELRPYPDIIFYGFDGVVVDSYSYSGTQYSKDCVKHILHHSTNKAEVEEYADCYRRLKLYQLLGKKAALKYPIDIKVGFYITDFEESMEAAGGIYLRNNGLGLGSAKFSREEDRLEALKLAGITKEFQEKCAKYRLGGA